MRPKSGPDRVADREPQRNADKAEGGLAGDSAAANRLFLRVCRRNRGGKQDGKSSDHVLNSNAERYITILPEPLE